MHVAMSFDNWLVWQAGGQRERIALMVRPLSFLHSTSGWLTAQNARLFSAMRVGHTHIHEKPLTCRRKDIMYSSSGTEVELGSFRNQYSPLNTPQIPTNTAK